MRSAGKLFGVFDNEDLDLRGKEIKANVPPPPPPSDLSGGTAYPNPTGTSKYIKFIANGTLTIADEDAVCDILVVGGGGAGGSYLPGQYAGGGGGAGGVRWCPSITLPIGTYPVQVGEGGVKGDPSLPPYAGGSYPPADAGSSGGGGGASSIFNPGDGNSIPAITGTGGGGGGSAGNSFQGDGGSAGGCSYSPGVEELAGNAGGDEPRANPVKEGGPNFPTNRSPASGGWNCTGGGGAGDVDGDSPEPRKGGIIGITLPGMGSPGDPWLPPAGNIFGGGGGGASYKSAGGLGEGGPGGGGDAGPTGNPGEDYTGGGGGGGGQGDGGNGGVGVVYIVTPSDNTVNPA